MVDVLGFCLPVWGWWNFKICGFASTGVTINSMAPSVHRSTTRMLENICQIHLFGQVGPYFESCDILRQHLLRTEFVTNLKKAHSRTSLSNQKLRRQNTNVPSFAKRALSSFPRDRWRNCRLNSSNSFGTECCCSFLATNGKGYDNSRLSDDIHRGSRQIHDKWLRFTCTSCTQSQNGLAMKTSVELLKKLFTLVLYEVVIEISTALHSVCICIMQNQTQNSYAGIFHELISICFI